jgi:hypothetical protein
LLVASAVSNVPLTSLPNGRNTTAISTTVRTASVQKIAM